MILVIASQKIQGIAHAIKFHRYVDNILNSLRIKYITEAYILQELNFQTHL